MNLISSKIEKIKHNLDCGFDTFIDVRNITYDKYVTKRTLYNCYLYNVKETNYGYILYTYDGCFIINKFGFTSFNRSGYIFTISK